MQNYLSKKIIVRYRYQVENPRCPHKQAKFGDCNGFSGNWVPGSVTINILKSAI